MSRSEWNAHVESLLSDRVREVLQVENLAVRQCQREAERLGPTAPADTLLAIGAHAEGTLTALLSVCAREGLQTDRGSAVGVWLWGLRERIADLLVQSEASFRSTLLGVRHGVGLMRVVSSNAGAASKLALAEFCSVWLSTRTVLLRRAEAELDWFARNPEKGADQRWLGERYGRVERGPALHPFTRETGRKGASNVGEDETSGSE
jgi:hypothetical protein